MDDRGLDLGVAGPRHRGCGESADGGGLFVVSEAVEYAGEDRQRVMHQGDAAGVQVMTDRQTQVVERVVRIIASGRRQRQHDGYRRLHLPVPAVLSDRQGPA